MPIFDLLLTAGGIIIASMALLIAYLAACRDRNKPWIYGTAAAYMTIHALVGGWGMITMLDRHQPAAEERSILSY